MLLLYIFPRAEESNGLGCKKCKSHAWPENALPKIARNGPDRKKEEGQRGWEVVLAPLPPLSHAPPCCVSIFSGLVFQPVTANATDDVCEFVYCNCLHCGLEGAEYAQPGLHTHRNI